MNVSARRISLQTKLLGALALGLLITLACALAGLASAWSNLSTEIPKEVAQAAQSEHISREFRVQIQEWKNILLRSHDPKLHAKHLAAFDEQGRQVQALAQELASAADDPTVAAMATDFARAHAELQTSYRDALKAFAESGHQPRVGDELVRGIDRAPAKALEDLVAQATSVADAAVIRSSEQARASLRISAIAAVASAVVLLVVIGWWLRRSVLAPIEAAARTARAVAQGDLDSRLVVSTRDEIGELAEAMLQMTRTLQATAQAQAEMASRHETGEMSYRMDASRFPGVYGRMVENTNALVGAQIAVIGRMLQTMQRYAIGDLAPDMDRLPGEQATITEAMDATKRNLAAINGEIRRLVDSAAAGDFRQRGNEQAFQHDFRAMVAGLNQLMDSIDANLSGLSALLRAIADGDLSARMESEVQGVAVQGVFALMRDDANATVLRLTEIVSGITAASHAISAAATEIAAGNDDLARRTEQQAASLEETAASMEELTTTVRQNAQTASEASRRAQETAGVADEGGRLVGSVVDTMADIQTSSRRIAEIIAVIDGIAFQTNILALNAAVEAARAGEQGRGFAVVASEVRALAQRSANAAKEIRDLIKASVDKVSEGSQLVTRAGDTMQRVVASVQGVSGLMGEISTASQEQAAGVDQVSQVVLQMDETTQQNASLVEEASAAARALQDQAASLVEAIAVFRTDSRQAATPRLAAVA